MTNHSAFDSHARPAPAVSWRGLSSTVWVLVVARAVNRLGAFTLPFLGVVLTVELGASVAEAGLVLTVFGLATIPSRVFGGHLADRLGAKHTIVVGLVGCAIAQAWIALSSTLWSAVLAAILLGLVFEIYEPPSQAIIADVTEALDRPAAYGLLGAAVAAGAVLAGLLAAALGHFDLRWLFAADAITCLACATLIAFALPTTSSRPASSAAGGSWRDPRLLAMLATGTVFATLYMQLVIGLPFTLLARDLPASTVGLVLAVSALTLVLAQPLQRLRQVRELDDFAAMAIGYLLLSAGLLANAFATTLPSFLAATVVWSLGDLLLFSRAYTIVAALAPDNARGRYMATYGLSWGIATTLAPIAGTQLLTAAGPTTLWTLSALTALVLALVQPAMRRHLSLPEV
ncbi:MFS transporter [Kribbella sp. NBC_01245]|uniref:MFS transporter n=1 Tax=Kribbella sp. NBC_01245 TaxID=2903578 RepID=UPI002E2B33C9|nr:MFS transporter [Kribbella sp. NBC_01245]